MPDYLDENSLDENSDLNARLSMSKSGAAASPFGRSLPFGSRNKTRGLCSTTSLNRSGLPAPRRLAPVSSKGAATFLVALAFKDGSEIRDSKWLAKS
jgi:hypothetical protein